MSTRRDVEFIVGKIISGFSVTEADEIPKIDLYMDQVLQFLSERLRRTARKSAAGQKTQVFDVRCLHGSIRIRE